MVQRGSEFPKAGKAERRIVAGSGLKGTKVSTISAQGCGETSPISEQQVRKLSLSERQRVSGELVDVPGQGLAMWDFSDSGCG